MSSELWKSIMSLPPDLFKNIPIDVYSQAAQQNVDQQQLNQILAQSQQGTWHQGTQANISPTPHDRARSLFLARLGGIRGSYQVKSEDFIWCHITSDMKTVHVFFVFGDQAGTTSEDSAMFPSDTLITQFRLLIP